MAKLEDIKGYVCPKCKWSDFFETVTCPRCQSRTEVTTLPRQGKLVTYTVIRYPPEGFEKDAPYIVGLIDLINGPRVIGRISAKPDQLRIAQPVVFAGTANGALQFAT